MADDPRLVVRFEQLGIETDLVSDWQIDSDYLVSTDGFSFTVNDSRLRGKRLECQPVELLLDGHQQLLGRIDVTKIGDRGPAITCEGRDYIADLVESHIDPLVVVGGETLLADALLIGLGPCGITAIFSDSDVTMRKVRTGNTRGQPASKDFRKLKLEELKPEPEMGCYEWANRIAARHGCTLQPSTKRNELILTAPNYDQEPLFTLYRSTDPRNEKANNIVRGVARRDYSKVPTNVLFTSKVGAKQAGKGTEKLEYGIDQLAYIFPELAAVLKDTAVPQRRKPSDTSRLDGKLYRFLYQKDEDSKNKEQLQSVARRAIADRLKDTLVYDAEIGWLKDPRTGAIWSIDTIANVQDEVTEVSEAVWVVSRSLSWSRNGGGKVSAKLLRKNVFEP